MPPKTCAPVHQLCFPKAPRALNHRITARQLIDAETELFGDRNPAEVTLTEIALFAGTSLAALRSHFATKQALISAVVENCVRLANAYSPD